MEQGIESQKEPGAKEKRLGALHHIGRGMGDMGVALLTVALGVVTLVAVGSAAAVVAVGGGAVAAVGGAVAAVGGAVAAVVAAVAAVGGGAVAAVGGVGGAILEKTTEKHAHAIAPEAAEKAHISGKRLLVGVALASSLMAGNWAYDDLTQDLSGKPAEPPTASAPKEEKSTATHYTVTGKDCILVRTFTAAEESNSLYRLSEGCVIKPAAIAPAQNPAP